MSNHKTGEWLDCTLAARPTSKKAKRPCAPVTVTFAVDGDDCPSREVADRLVNAPVLLDMTERRLAEVGAERDALRRWQDEVVRLTAHAPGLPVSGDEFSTEDVPALLAVVLGLVDDTEDYDPAKFSDADTDRGTP